MITLFSHAPNKKQYAVLYCAAWIIRALFFLFYMQHDMHYQQPDTVDYHISAFLITHTYGMTHPNGKPIFWRTPGYPYFLSLFYDPHIRDSSIKKHTQAHHNALWAQITLCSLMPVLSGTLAQILTGNPTVIWLSAISGVIHPGYILASTYILTDGIATLLFMLFLISLFVVVRFRNEAVLSITTITALPWSRRPLIVLCLSASALALYTWMRPMGQFIGILTSILLLFCEGTLFKKVARSGVFLVTFSLLLAPWYIRNYQLTQSFFFCPLFGLYFNAFPAPKILARIKNISLADAHKELSQAAGKLTYQETVQAAKECKGRIVCGENVCLRTAWPLIADHPLYFMEDWITEMLKTTFDLYASQLVALANNCFQWDPLIEFLPEKIKACLYEKPMPLLFRALAWMEFLLYILLWIGIYSGIYTFLLKPIWQHTSRDLWYSYGFIWIRCGILVITVIAQTGGFGYARLRLPIEPLIIICGITFFVWHNTYYRYQKVLSI